MAAPTIILQLIVTIVFLTIWIKANKNTTRALVAQLKTIEELYQNDKQNLDFLDSYKNNFEIGISGELPTPRRKKNLVLWTDL